MIIYVGSDSVILRGPEPGDTESLDTKILENTTRGGNFTPYIETGSISEKTYNWQFTGISATGISDLRDFILAYQGQIVSVADYFSRVLQGFILVDSLEILEERPSCSYSVTFSFLQHSPRDFEIRAEDNSVIYTEQGTNDPLLMEEYYANGI